jgi:hypothetical protein
MSGDMEKAPRTGIEEAIEALQSFYPHLNSKEERK